ncbi:hypothetical protein [Sphingomonas adhaesiva]|uniref:hypothetical protein n=1 Tax=Sphingomonas adhaesiva TaxID=28212 RepID=UPI002FFC66E5
MLVVILLCLTINAMICGAISGNAERYQSRVMWLVPMISYLICFDALARRRPKSGYFPL